MVRRQIRLRSSVRREPTGSQEFGASEPCASREGTSQSGAKQNSWPASATRLTRRKRKFKPPTPRESQDEERFFVIEKLLDKRYTMDGFEEYLVRWQNYSAEWDSWEPRDEIERNSLELVLEFNRLQRQDGSDEEDSGDTLHCKCRKTYRFADGGMIQCFNCFTWFHFKCIQMNMEEANMYAFYYCEECRQLNPSLKNMIKAEKCDTIPGRAMILRSNDQK